MEKTDDSPQEKRLGETDDLVEHIGADIWQAFRAYENAMYESVADHGFPDISVADSEILVLVAAKGTRLVDIARGRRISKQAAHEQIQSLVGRGYLSVENDPTDRRAKIIRHTEMGKRLIEEMREVKVNLNRKVEAAIGTSGLTQLKALLAWTKTAVE
ncbi:MAG: MarR family winged helix-turn-helix transcriptional regulator [Pseudomonadota bacterium]